MIANAQFEIQIVDTHESLETLINVDVDAGTSQFNRTLVGEHRFSPHPRTQEQSSTLSENSEENLVLFTMLAFYIEGHPRQGLRYRGTQFRGLFGNKGEPRSKRRRMFRS